MSEVIVSATLVATMASVVLPLSLQSNRLWQQARYQQMAVEALSSEMEVLLSTTATELEAATEDLTPPDELQRLFPAARIRSDIVEDADGTQITLHFSWRSPATESSPNDDVRDREAASLFQRPIQLTAWYDVKAREPQP